MTTSHSPARVIEVTGLHKRYGDKLAVDGVDLHVDAGEIVAVLGPNGAGKTTTVEILEGYRHRDSGRVHVLGEDPQTAGLAWRARLGIVLQSVNDMAEATVEELVRHFAQLYPDPRDVDDVIEAVGLVEKRRTRAQNLSGGQRRRLDVALGIVGRPELLFLDEPTTGFDPEARHAFWDLVLTLRAEGTTILLTTHYLEEAEHLADRVLVVNDGHVIAQGPPASLGGDQAHRTSVRWTEHGAEHAVATDTPTRVVAELATRFASLGLSEVPGLRVQRPSLEEIYLGLLGGAAAAAADPELMEVDR